MRKKYLEIPICVFILLMVSSPVYSQTKAEVMGNGVHYRDSLYTRIFENSCIQASCLLSYPVGRFQVDSGLGNNGMELAGLRQFLNCALADVPYRVRKIIVSGYSSVDGMEDVNVRLALERANSLLRYLNVDYRLSGNYPVEVLGKGADWAKLRELIATSSYKWREDALRIIDGPGSPGWKKIQIAYLDGGDAHKRLYEELYPRLRRVEIEIHYDVQCKKYKIRRAELPDMSNCAIKRLKLQTISLLPQKPQRSPLYPVLAIKTNLFTWAGMTPEFKYHRFMPNLEAELFFARRWSAVVSATYADWDYNKEKHWGVSSYRLEPRLWLKGDRRYRYFYLGAFGQAGDYNDRSTIASQGRTGTYWQAGLSAGCYLPLTRRLGVELGVRGGYSHASSDYYSIESSFNYYDYTTSSKRFGLSGIEVGLSYRFGK